MASFPLGGIDRSLLSLLATVPKRKTQAQFDRETDNMLAAANYKAAAEPSKPARRVIEGDIDSREGLLVNFWILPSLEHCNELSRQGYASPSAVLIKAMLDTGATQSSVESWIPSHFRLGSIGEGRYVTASAHEYTSELFRVGLIHHLQPMAFVSESLVVHSVPSGKCGHHAIIGNDVLSGTSIELDRSSGKFRWTC